MWSSRTLLVHPLCGCSCHQCATGDLATTPENGSEPGLNQTSKPGWVFHSWKDLQTHKDNDLDLEPRFRCGFGGGKGRCWEGKLYVNYVSVQQMVRFESTGFKKTCFKKELFESICSALPTRWWRHHLPFQLSQWPHVQLEQIRIFLSCADLHQLAVLLSLWFTFQMPSQQHSSLTKLMEMLLAT